MAAQLDHFQVGVRLHMPKIFVWFQHRQPADSGLYDYYEFSLAAVMPGATVPALDRDSMNRVTKGCTALEEIQKNSTCALDRQAIYSTKENVYNYAVQRLTYV
jgi:hypothetical protein